MSAIPDDLRAALGGRYELQSVLGRGGMASVYLAADTKHHRSVAIKVLRPDLAASIGADRFLIEIEIAARLTHPHILPLHDSGEAAGFLYYVMPYIDGGSMRVRIDSGKRREPAVALGITVGIASALSYAHRMGVVHRDIKPENILFAQGLPVVADFGIAKAISTAGGAQLTRTGFPLGTPGYMSPEQAAGLNDLDARTDVYALAVVTYEMLIGVVPGRWPTEDAVRMRRFIDAPAGHREVLDTLPVSFEPALVHAMAIRHDQRTASAEEFAGELRGMVGRGDRGPRTVDRGTGQALPVPGPPSLVPEKRHYSDDEVEEIVRRASELEVSKPTLGGSFTIGGLQQVGVEAGIDPALIREAAGRLDRPSSAGAMSRAKPRAFSGEWWAGGPTRINVERVVLGEVTESDCAYLIEEVRSVLGTAGITSILGRTVTWVAQRSSNSGLTRDVQVSLTMRAGQTRIVIRERLGQLAGGIFGGIGGGLGGGGLGPILGATVGGLHAPALALVIAPLWLATVLSGARTAYHYASNARRRELEKLADSLASMATALIAEGMLPPGSPSRQIGPA